MKEDPPIQYVVKTQNLDEHTQEMQNIQETELIHASKHVGIMVCKEDGWWEQRESMCWNV